mmetsp:Transcript_94651/g.131557  ORF Transcript_94651/g.131557 Transcript_94651/m.131557 type:complete len:101 (+) Transcript_94651:34-336(+)
MAEAIVYSTSTGGMSIQRHTERMCNIVTAITKAKPTVVYIDIDGSKKQEVWATSGKKGVYPLLFFGDEFIGDKDQVEELNEIGQLAEKLGKQSNVLAPAF